MRTFVYRSINSDRTRLSPYDMYHYTNIFCKTSATCSSTLLNASKRFISGYFVFRSFLSMAYTSLAYVRIYAKADSVSRKTNLAL